jgi:TonB family protein
MSHLWTPSRQIYRSQSGSLALHLVPGLEQMSRGETRKGLLLMSAAMFNLFFLSVLLLKNWLLTNAAIMSQLLHTRVNTTVIDCLKDVSMRSPQMVSLCALLTFFIYMSVKDAKSTKPASSRIYPSSIMDIREAASGSYVLHSCIFFSMLLLVLFLIVPPAPHPQVTTIEFQTPQLETKKIIHSERRSEKASENSGLKDPTKEVAPSARGAQQPRQHEQSKSQAKPSPQPAPDQPAEPTVKRSEGPPLKTPQPNKPQTSTSPPPPTAVSPPKPPLPQPNFHAQLPKSAALAPVPLPTFNHSSVAPPAIPHVTAPMPASASSLTRQNTAPPLPLIANAALPSAPVGPLPAASSSFGKTGQPAPHPMAPLSPGASHSESSSIAAPPMRTPTGTSSDQGSAPSPIPGSRHSSAAPTGNGGAPTPKTINTGHGYSPIAILTPVGNGTSDSGIGTPATTGKAGPQSPPVEIEINWGPYMADLQRRIKRAWYPPKFHESNRVVVIFKIHKNGELSHLRLVTASGSSIVDQAAMRAVETAAPFRALPAGAGDDIDVQFTFDYNLFNGGSSPVKY